MEKEYSLDEVSISLHVHIESVRRWVRSGRLKAHRRVGSGRAWFVKASELERFINDIEGADRQTNGNSPAVNANGLG